MSTKLMSRLVLMCSGSLIAATAAHAQEAAPPPPAPEEDVSREIIVTGTQIQGAKINDVLPVTVVDEIDIQNVAATSGDELFRAIPQAGGVAFNEQNDVTSNNARGDAASINLRDLGTGNTLLLINGRRMVLNPGFQTELLVPVVSPDTNEIAPGSVRRLEVLRDGASAIYGADAVAGVVNTVLRGNRKGGFIEGEYRLSDGTNAYATQLNGGYGFDFADGRANLTVYGSYFHENATPASARAYSADDDKRPLLVGTDFEGDTQFNNRNTFGPFGQFDLQITNNNQTPIRDDDFYIQPSTQTGCRFDLGNGLCARNGETPAVDVRYNRAFGTTLISEKTRYNAALLLNYEFSNNIEGYFEGTFYRSESSRNITPAAILSAVPVGISRNAYWNPFGPVTFPGGVPNPNRRPGTTIPAAGADLIMERYRFVDAGNRTVDVDKNSYRLVAGLKGNFGAWDFDTGFVYSEARSTDLEGNRVSLTLFQQAVNRSTPDAYNPFNGGCIDDPANGDCTPNPASSIDPFRISVFRKGGTSLALADFKVSNSSLLSLPGGDVGIAAGIEWRRETFFDNRDPRIDGTITWTDSVIPGVRDGSDVAGTSASPDTSGAREVWSAFAETFVPLVSEGMDIPLINSLNLQLAGRMEHFRDIDQTAIVPRAAASWSVVPGVMLRGAWSQGFRAPNLVQVNDEGTTRSNTRDDFVRCQAQVLKGQLANLGLCPGEGVISFRSGTDQLEPEDSESINLGVVLEPKFIPGLTLTADYWRVKQTGLVGTFGDDNAIALDLLLRLTGSSNPAVIRSAPTAEQIALYAGTGLAAAGDIIQVLDPYINLDSRVSKGWDFGLAYNVPDFGLGKFRLRFNAARLNGFVQSAGADGQTLLDAVAAGTLPPEVRVEGLGQLLELDGRPKWRFSGSMNWGSGPIDLSIFAQYVGEVWNTSVSRDVPIVSDDPNANFWRVNDMLTINTAFTFTIDDTDGPLDGTRLRVGVNNLFDKDPPLADETYGFLSQLHSPRGRVVRFEIRKNF
ncbi:TonB-dependent receptor domain-containing protein [Porphyrobacter sp. CACIAM 03H1]|uniref:TonB-dependent receptor domain-containing protein n=1 Tax=Porphyrobacter sp. CACIAM 03H1 TaxID=2003315 RepID=UPI000B5AB825|nr:TonB-dependent receptor [Porphyrobacter sp. CACIAM 03H1]ASJ92335.1 TonB-dependent receptor [Porphyrobacter sp. CACIAM 03H1]